MSNVKRVLSMLLVLVMMLAITIPASFAESGQASGRIDSILIKTADGDVVSISTGQYIRAYSMKVGTLYEYLVNEDGNLSVYGIASGEKYISISKYIRAYSLNEKNVAKALEEAEAIDASEVATFYEVESVNEETGKVKLRPIGSENDDIKYNDDVVIIKEPMSINEPTDKTVIIPEDINGIVLDFNGNEVRELIVRGSGNTIKNATITRLCIEETVDNLFLENIDDASNSKHTFNGGGGNSIKLRGNTTFKGNINITSGTDIQIKAESEDAKIEGIVSVESSAKTTISAPVSNLVVDTENSQVVVNAKIDRIAVRNDATITVSKGIDMPTIEARIGTTVTAIDGEGKEVEVIVECALDTYELDLNISEAKYRIENISEGSYDGNVVEGEKQKLKIALGKAQNALQYKEITEENQANIDQAAKKLKDAIEEFDSRKVKVDKRELNNLIHDIDLFLNYNIVVIGEDIGNYPQDSYDEFKTIFDEIRGYLNSNKVTQDGVDTRLKQLQNAFQKFKSSKIIPVETKGIAQFKISGDSIEYWQLKTEDIVARENSKGFWRNVNNIGEDSIEVNKDNGQINIKINDIYNYEEFIFPIEINYEYAAFLRVSSDEIQSGQIKEIFLNDFASINISVEDENLGRMARLYLLDEDEVEVTNIWVDNRTKIQPGKYSICYIIEEADIPYYAYTPGIDLNGMDKKFEFRQEDFAKVELKLNQIYSYNYTLDSVYPSKYWLTPGLKINYENPIFYLSKGEYRDISSAYIMDIGENKYRVTIDKNNVEYLNGDMIIQYSDDLKITNWRDSEYADTITVFNKKQELNNDGYFRIVNDLNQETYRFYKVNEDGYSDYSYVDKYLIKITSGDKEYTKEISRDELNSITFEDIIGEDNLEGEFTLEISIQEIPIVKPYIQKMRFENQI